VNFRRTFLPSTLVLWLAGTALPQTRKPAEPASIEYGVEQRVRTEDWNNILDYTNKIDDEREQIRYRTRAWLKLPVTSTVDFFVGMEQETNQKLGKDNAFDEAIFENLYLDFKKVFVKGLSLRVGRQNITRGEGFLLFEGSPGDGSRGIYYNAVNLAYEFKKSRIEAIGILNPKFDRMLPVINSCNKPLQDWDDQAVGLYYTGHDLKRTGIEAYYFYKKEVKDYLAPTNPQFQPDRHVSTAGGRIVQQLDKEWSATGEFAAQWGAQHGGKDIRAWGGYGYLKRTFAHPKKPYFQLGYWAFSGDDPKSNRIGGFDPLFSRWPKWSELYIYSQVKEQGVGYWTNTNLWQAEAGFAPDKRSTLRATYYKMGAYYPFAGDSRIFAGGLNRGSLFETRFDYAFNRHIKGHALYEGLLPGSYYTAKNFAYFVRFEMTYNFTAQAATGPLFGRK
jgi:hypothetical protein